MKSKKARIYENYLKSKAWKAKRAQALDWFGNECGTCGSKYHLEVHHKTYKNIFKETMADLMLMCNKCHYKEHAGRIERKRRKDSEVVTYYPNRARHC